MLNWHGSGQTVSEYVAPRPDAQNLWIHVAVGYAPNTQTRRLFLNGAAVAQEQVDLLDASNLRLLSLLGAADNYSGPPGGVIRSLRVGTRVHFQQKILNRSGTFAEIR